MRKNGKRQMCQRLKAPIALSLKAKTQRVNPVPTSCLSSHYKATGSFSKSGQSSHPATTQETATLLSNFLEAPTCKHINVLTLFQNMGRRKMLRKVLQDCKPNFVQKAMPVGGLWGSSLCIKGQTGQSDPESKRRWEGDPPCLEALRGPN